VRHTDTQRRCSGGPLSLLSLLKKESRQIELHNRTSLSHSGNFGHTVIVVRELHRTWELITFWCIVTREGFRPVLFSLHKINTVNTFQFNNLTEHYCVTLAAVNLI
jgi:hypothetical protein